MALFASRRSKYAMEKNIELELEAVALVRQYGLFLKPALPFLRRLSDYLNWQELKGMLK